MSGSTSNVVKYNNSFLHTIHSGPGKRLLEEGATSTHEFLNLPQDIIHTILLNLPFKDIHTYSMTCKTAYKIRNDTGFWQLLHQRDFPFYLDIKDATIKMYHNLLHRCSSNLGRGVYASSCIDNDEPQQFLHGAWKFAVFEGKIFASSATGEIKVWDIKTLDCLKTIRGDFGPCRSLIIAKDMLIVAYSVSIRVWNIETWDCVKDFEVNDSWAIKALVHDDGLLVSVALNGEIKVWDLKTWDCLHTFGGNPMGECALAIIEGKLLSGFSLGPRHSQYQPRHKFIKIWNLETGKLLDPLCNKEKGVSSIFAQGKEKLIIGSDSGVIKVWDLKNMTCLHSLEDHKTEVNSLLIAEGKLISGDGDGKIKIWDLKTYKCECTLQMDSSGIFSLAFEDGKLFISIYNETGILVLDFKATDEQIISELVDLFMTKKEEDTDAATDRYRSLPEKMREKIDFELALKQNTGS